MKLSKEELERYARHIVLQDVGGSGQQLLKQARVLVIGAGGLGSAAIQYLAAAGIGTIGIIDDDVVSISNLQRQTIHDTASCGLHKTESAKEFVARLNPHVRVETWAERLEADNGGKIVSAYDIVLDGCDNFKTRYLAADLCEEHGVTLISAAVGLFDGSITTLKPHANDADGKRYPRYRDVFPEAPPDGLIPSCEEAGIIGALTGILGSMQALECIKEITGAGESLAGRLLMYDSRSARFHEIKYNRSDPV